MSDLHLIDDLYLTPTPGGAYYAVTGFDDEPLRRLLLALLSQRSSPRVSTENLRGWLEVKDDREALKLLHRAQSLALVQGNRSPMEMPSLGIGQELRDLLPSISSTGKGLLVDWNGLALVHTGMNEETAETLSALSADLIAVQNRHATRLAEHFGLGTHGWAAVDAYGSSRIGAWPLYIGKERFMLVLLGEPLLNRREFIILVWALFERYGRE
ncbi:MAG TPA: roadblock/LC7 domain-containing protein [Chromatiales bacterium]|nr:roadblock/LC7 domain-containing protein [Chromatiales bacterium]